MNSKMKKKKLKKQVGQKFPQRVKKRKFLVKKSKKLKKPQENEHAYIDYLKITPAHPRDRLARLEKVLKDEIKYLKTVHSNRRDRLSRLEKMLKDKIKYLKTVLSHPRDRLGRLEKTLKDKMNI